MVDLFVDMFNVIWWGRFDLLWGTEVILRFVYNRCLLSSLPLLCLYIEWEQNGIRSPCDPTKTLQFLVKLQESPISVPRVLPTCIFGNNCLLSKWTSSYLFVFSFSRWHYQYFNHSQTSPLVKKYCKFRPMLCISYYAIMAFSSEGYFPFIHMYMYIYICQH
jgi:hypothetical protein